GQNAWQRLIVGARKHAGDAVAGAGVIGRRAALDGDEQQVPVLVGNRIRQHVLVVDGAAGFSGVEGAQSLELVAAGVDDPGDVLLVVVQPRQVGGVDA